MSLRYFKVVLFILLTVGACHSWSPTQVPAPARPLEGNPQEARVTRTDGSVILLRSPFVKGDTLVGFTDLRAASTADRVAIPVAEIRTVQTRKVNILGTTALLLIVGAAAVAVFYASNSALVSGR